MLELNIRFIMLFSLLCVQFYACVCVYMCITRNFCNTLIICHECLKAPTTNFSHHIQLVCARICITNLIHFAFHVLSKSDWNPTTWPVKFDLKLYDNNNSNTNENKWRNNVTKKKTHTHTNNTDMLTKKYGISYEIISKDLKFS